MPIPDRPHDAGMGADLWEKQRPAREGTNGFLTPAPAEEPAKKTAKKSAKKK